MSTTSLSSLRSALSGRVITGHEPEYDAFREVFAGDIDRRPSAIVRPVDAADVLGVISFARESGTPLAVRRAGTVRSRASTTSSCSTCVK